MSRLEDRPKKVLYVVSGGEIEGPYVGYECTNAITTGQKAWFVPDAGVTVMEGSTGFVELGGAVREAWRQIHRLQEHLDAKKTKLHARAET